VVYPSGEQTVVRPAPSCGLSPVSYTGISCVSVIGSTAPVDVDVEAVPRRNDESYRCHVSLGFTRIE
jgi:hypothetical protein